MKDLLWDCSSSLIAFSPPSTAVADATAAAIDAIA